MAVTGCVVIRMCSLNTCKSLHGGQFHLVFVHTPLNVTLAVRRYGIYIDKYLLQAVSLLC